MSVKYQMFTFETGSKPLKHCLKSTIVKKNKKNPVKLVFSGRSIPVRKYSCD